jgi:hypothetical protein
MPNSKYFDTALVAAQMGSLSLSELAMKYVRSGHAGMASTSRQCRFRRLRASSNPEYGILMQA